MRVLCFDSTRRPEVEQELGAQLEAASRFPGRVVVFMELDLEGCCGAAWSEREVARLALALGMRVLAVREHPERSPDDPITRSPDLHWHSQIVAGHFLGLGNAEHAQQGR